MSKPVGRPKKYETIEQRLGVLRQMNRRYACSSNPASATCSISLLLWSDDFDMHKEWWGLSCTENSRFLKRHRIFGFAALKDMEVYILPTACYMQKTQYWCAKYM